MIEKPQLQPVQNPLTLVMTAKSPEACVGLRRTVEHLQSLPAEKNPIITALDRLGTVHFARFAFLDHNQLAVITTYDGDFETYINEFVNEIGEVFDTLLQYVADAPPLPVQTYRDEFLEFVRKNDRGAVGIFYSAYPERTVLDIIDRAGATS